MRLLSRLVALIPVGLVRHWAMRSLLNVELGEGARVGFGVVIDVESISLGAGAIIDKFCKFRGPMRVEVGENAWLGAHNTFDCGAWAAREQFADAGYARRLVIGDGAMLTEGHYFDVVGSVEIGPNTWIAGRSSQFWTHGVGTTERDISIGEGCYIGSAVLVAPGARIGARNVVAMGSLLTRDFGDVSQSLIAGSPAKVARCIKDDLAAGKIVYERNW